MTSEKISEKISRGEALAFVAEEGGSWEEWRRTLPPERFVVVLFDDGEIWDVAVGPRPRDSNYVEAIKRYLVSKEW